MDTARTPKKSSTTMPPFVLELVMQQFPPVEALSFRLVCKSWDAVIGQSPGVGELSFRVSCPESTKAFRTLSPSLKVKHFEFESLDLEKSLFIDQTVFRHFTLKHCPRIATLHFRKCYLFMGRLIELLAFCKRLETLAIQRCPSFYRADWSIVHWGFCFDYVKKNLGGLSTFKMMEHSISEEDLSSLASYMTSLKKIQIGQVNDQVALPRLAIINLLANSSETVKELILVGNLFDKVKYNQITIMEGIREMKAMTSITLMKGNLNSDVQALFLQYLLEHSPNLKQLKLANARINKETLWKVEESLTTLDLQDCTFGTGMFETTPALLQKLRIVQTVDVVNKGVEEAIVSLLKSKLPVFENLELCLTRRGNRYVNLLNPTQHPQLSSVSFQGFVDIRGPALRTFFKKFPKLQSLSIEDCDVLEDEAFCCIQKLGDEETLSNLTELRTLNLSGTKVGNRTAFQCILKLKKLECLRLERTNVNRTSLMQITKAVEENKLPALRYIGFMGTPCKLTKEELGSLKERAPLVIISCPRLEL